MFCLEKGCLSLANCFCSEICTVAWIWEFYLDHEGKDYWQIQAFCTYALVDAFLIWSKLIHLNSFTDICCLFFSQKLMQNFTKFWFSLLFLFITAWILNRTCVLKFMAAWKHCRASYEVVRNFLSLWMTLIVNVRYKSKNNDNKDK